MALQGGTSKPSKAIKIPRLLAQVNKYQLTGNVHTLATGHPSSDPTIDGHFDWSNPRLSLFTRDMTPEILAMNPVVVLERYLTSGRNAKKNPRGAVKRWVVPGNSSLNGEQYNAGFSGSTRGGTPIPEFPNFTGINNTGGVGYNTVIEDFELPVARCVSDSTSLYTNPIAQAIYVPNWIDSVTFSQHKRNRNHYLKFRVSLAVPNPDWTATNHLNKYLLGEGQTVIVEPRLQTFNNGSGVLEYYIGWKTKVVN